MINSAEFFHFSAMTLTVTLPAISVGIGEGIASNAAIKAIDIQPAIKSEILRVAVIGMALIETAAIMGMSMAIILLLTPASSLTYYAGVAELGIPAALGLPGFFIGLFSALPTYAACHAAARQPFFIPKILRFMLVTQSLLQTPVIFGFIIAMFIKNQIHMVTTLPTALKYIASGLSLGLGSIGPAIGMALFAQAACKGIGVNRNAYNKLFNFAIISQAIIETPIIFSLVVALMLMFNNADAHSLLTGIMYMSAAICIGIGTIGAGIGSGKIAASACEQIVHKPELHGALSRLSMFGQGLIDTCAIYALLIAIMILRWG